MYFDFVIFLLRIGINLNEFRILMCNSKLEKGREYISGLG